MSGRPLAIDLFCGLGGWTEGLLAEGYEVIGYDIEAHEYDGERYPAKARKAASARIAKIPLTLSRWIAAHYRPERIAA